MLHFWGSIRDLDIGGDCQSQKSCNFDHFFVSRLPAALEQCRGGRGAQCGTVSGVGLAAWCGAGTAPWVDTHTAPWSGTGAALRKGTGAVRRDDAYPASWSGTGAMVWKSAGAALWGGAGVVLGANAALRHGMARIRRCGVRPLWRHREVRGAVEAVFRFGCQNGQIAKSFQNFIGKTHLKKIFLDGAGTAKYFVKLCLFAKQPVATKEEMTRGSV